MVCQHCVIDINPLSLKLRIMSFILVLDNDILLAWYRVNFTILWWWNWTGYFSNKTPKIFWSGVMLQVNMHQLPQCIVASKLCFTLMTALLCCSKAPTHCNFVYYTFFNTDSYTLGWLVGHFIITSKNCCEIAALILSKFEKKY